MNIRVVYTIYYNYKEDRYKIYIVNINKSTDFIVDGKLDSYNEMLVYIIVYLQYYNKNFVYVGSWLYLIKQEIALDYQNEFNKRIPIKYKIKNIIIKKLDNFIIKIKKW